LAVKITDMRNPAVHVHMYYTCGVQYMYVELHVSCMYVMYTHVHTCMYHVVHDIIKVVHVYIKYILK